MMRSGAKRVVRRRTISAIAFSRAEGAAVLVAAIDGSDVSLAPLAEEPAGCVKTIRPTISEAVA